MLVFDSLLRKDSSSKTEGPGVALPHYHSIHAVHVSVYFKALDDAGFFAVNSLVEDVFVLTVSFSIHLLRPVASGDMKAIGKVAQASKNMFTAEATLTNSKGEEIARGIGTYVRSKASLSPDIGYE
jgi:acyl-coenzyme A thioesterase PaaI-like protein